MYVIVKVNANIPVSLAIHNVSTVYNTLLVGARRLCNRYHWSPLTWGRQSKSDRTSCRTHRLLGSQLLDSSPRDPPSSTASRQSCNSSVLETIHIWFIINIRALIVSLVHLLRNNRSNCWGLEAFERNKVGTSSPHQNLSPASTLEPDFL